VLRTYQITNVFPSYELYGLTSQIRRAAASIPANIEEGCGRESETELKRFLVIAMGSASELEYHFILARDLNFIDHAVYPTLEAQVFEVKRMLRGLIKKL
jgi:four helix bundle protein